MMIAVSTTQTEIQPRGKGMPEDERINLVMDRRTGKHADERNDRQPVNGFHENSPICWLAIEARSGSIPGAPRKRPTGEPIGRGELKAVSPLIKVIDRLDKHQETVVAKHTYGPEER